MKALNLKLKYPALDEASCKQIKRDEVGNWVCGYLRRAVNGVETFMHATTCASYYEALAWLESTTPTTAGALAWK